jgi:predicted small secreted protein
MRVVMLGLVLALAGCNTVAGVGRDLSAGADTVGGWFR